MHNLQGIFFNSLERKKKDQINDRLLGCHSKYPQDWVLGVAMAVDSVVCGAPILAGRVGSACVVAMCWAVVIAGVPLPPVSLGLRLRR